MNILRTRTYLLALILTAALALSACGWFSGQDPAVVEDPSDPAASFPVTVTDYAGRTVTVPDLPGRIVSLAPSNTEILFAIGAGDRVVGVDDDSNYPAEARDLPKLGGVYGLSYEAIVDLEPDLVLVIGGMVEMREQLEGLGLTLAVIQPADFDEILESMLLVGKLTGAVDAAEALVQSLKDEAASLAAALEGVSPSDRPRVFVEIWDDPLMTVGPGGFIHQLIEMAGGENLAADADMEWFMIDEEVVLDRDPDVIVTFFGDSHRAITAGNRPGWSSISAVASGRVYTIDSDLLVRPGPRIVKGLWQLGRLFHPDLID